ncbi:hypothetical protein F5883DRAFT_606458 [Diaporthe sp. PMI_573]|nr:hypothetical protein F5883DRAFT_606458 [Diaporthaceae sp. PMI_573]
MDAAFSSPITCAENISLLFLLHPTPSPPIRIPVNAEPLLKAGYSLPFEKERSLTSTLAFLCSIRDDPNRIPAVCIEEDPDSAGLVIVIAINKASWADGLLRGAIQSLDNAKSKVCEARRAFQAQAKNVLKLAGNWTKHQTEARLSELVEGVHLLRQIDGLHNLLDSIPNDLMSPSSRENLWNIITKVARQAKVVSVNLPEGVFARVPRSCYTPSLQSTLARINSENDVLHNTERVFHSLGIRLKDAERSFAQQTRQTLEKAKIHAEVQLEWHCQTRNLKRPPRVICSSKDACFLCYKLIAASGKLHIPKSHGRLYPGWRLPVVPGSDEKPRRFNAILEENIRQSIRAVLVSRKKTLYPDPLESTILTLQRSASTLASSNPSLTVSGKLESGASDPTNKLMSISPRSGSSKSTADTTQHSHPSSEPVEEGLADIIEYSAHAGEEREHKPRQLNYEVECLSVGDMDLTRTQSQYPVIDAEKADYACSYPITELRIFYISYRGKLLKVKLKGNVA